MEPADVAERTVRWAPGVGATVVGAVALLIVGLMAFDLSLDRVSVDGLADDGHMERPPSEGLGEAPEDDGEEPRHDVVDSPDELGATLHVLVAGSDDRSVLTPEERRELSTGHVGGERTEALALVRVDPDRDRVDVLRFPRDLLVTRCDGTRGRINAAYAIGEREGMGGSTCLVETVSTWTGIPIHHFVKIDFRGFVDVVEAIGGVELSLDEPLVDRRSGLDLPAGCVRLDGPDALAFVRARHLDDDFGRIDRQQELIAATMDQVLTASTLRDPRRLGRLLITAQRSLQVDDRLSAHRMRAIAATVAALGSDDLVTRTVDGEIRLSDQGAAFLHADSRHAEELFDAFVRGELPSAPRSGQDATGEASPDDDDASEADANADATVPDVEDRLPDTDRGTARERLEQTSEC